MSSVQVHFILDSDDAVFQLLQFIMRQISPSKVIEDILKMDCNCKTTKIILSVTILGLSRALVNKLFSFIRPTK